MPKYILLYRGDVTPTEDLSEAEHDAVMDRWGVWLEAHGDEIEDPGFPFGAGAAVGGDGSDQPATNLTGYSIVEADSLDAAKELCHDHPFLYGAGAELTVQVFELLLV
jgi:hypothetical protein